jgi:inner membrane protein involved in colicin E2 resistance
MKQQFAIWKMAWLKAGLVALVTGFTTLQTSLNGITWEALNGTQRVLLVGGVVVAMASSIIAFLDRTISRITEEQKQLNPAPPAPQPPTP